MPARLVIVDLSPGYRELRPPDALRPALSCLWVRVVPPGAARAVPVLPDACTDLIWRPGAGVFVAGPDNRPVLSPVTPGDVVVGVRFRPGAGGPALGMPLSALLNQRAGAADLDGAGAALAAALPGWLAPEQALRRLARLAGELTAAGPPDPLVRAAARYLDRPGAQAGQAARALGVSERQLRRRCEAAAGYGPAVLRRVLRFRRFLAGLDAAGAGADLGLLAAGAGYTDQAHLTRETARLAGLTPAALAAARGRG